MKKLYIYLLAVLTFSLSSCEKLLDIKPSKEVASDELLKTRKGYESALAGMYYDMSKLNLYGSNLQFGLMDVLAGYWDISSSEHRYYRLRDYNYASMNGTVEAFWAPMYKVIFNANNIINKLEAQSSLSIDEKIILGEALGIRSQIHLDIFRLYGPVIKQEGLTANAPPYRKVMNAKVEPFIPAADFLNFLIEDLNKAAALLENDPILTNGGVRNGNPAGAINYNSLLDRRRIRFNVNAASALLARVYQLLDNPEKAREYALKTLEKTDAKFVTTTDLNQSVTADIRLTKEIIFGLYARNHYEETRGQFGIDGANVIVSSSYYVNYDQMNGFIYTILGDYRRNRWFQNSLNYTVFTRYAKAPEAQEAFLAYRPEISLISLSELHYIIAESYMQSAPEKTMEYLNIVLKNRGATSLLDVTGATPETAKKELIKEARRQYFGEGQLFFLLKRLFLDIDRSETSSTKAALDIYKLLIPKRELDFNN